jgi:signal transduction histidine kinase
MTTRIDHDLRKRAEAVLAQRTAGTRSAEADNTRMLHELQVHQIELEMQNEELRVARVDVEAGLKRYTDLYDFAPVGYLTLSPEGMLRELNLPAARLLGRERSRLVSNRLRSFVSEGTRAAFDAWLVDVFTAHGAQACEVILLRDAAPPVAVRLEARLSFDGQSGRAVVTDITAQRVLEKELRQAQKLEVIGRLAGGVAHDFNSILGAMLLNLDILRVPGGSPAESAAALVELDQLSKRAARLTEQLLLFSRRQVIRSQRIDLNAALSQVLPLLERLVGDHIICGFRAGASPLWVEGDVAVLEQVLLILSLNARDAMLDGGTLTFEASRVDLDLASVQANPKARIGPFVCLQVSDSGTGMGKEVLEHLFEPFFTTKDVGNSGLGLAAVEGAVAQHCGWVNVESRVGSGTTFRIYLPESGPPKSTPVLRPPDTAANGRGETLLVVDDEPALLTITARSLSRLGYRVLLAADARQALEVWEQQAQDIDLMLTDVRMPGGMSGKELAERLRAAKPSLKVILMSGYDSELARCGVQGEAEFVFLPKPFDLQALARCVRGCLDEVPLGRAR